MERSRSGSGLLSTALALITLVAVVAVFTGADLADSERPAAVGLRGTDLAQQFDPNLRFLAEMLHDGQWPLWNPRQMAGYPFLAAHQTMAAYPPTLVAALVAPQSTSTVFVVSHLVAIALFGFAFLRRLGVGHPAAIAGALTYLFSSMVMLGVFVYSYLACFAWLPAMLWAGDRLIEQPCGRRASLLAACLAASINTGYAQGTLICGQALALLCLWRLVEARRRDTARIVLWLGASALLALALAAVQILPTAELVARSGRSAGSMSIDEADEPVLRAGELGGRRPHLQGFSREVSTTSLLLAPAAVAALADPRTRSLAALFSLLWLAGDDLSRGREGWLFDAYWNLPGVNLFRAPFRLALFSELAAAVLIALGMHAGLARIGDRRLRAAASVLLVVAVGLEMHWRNPIEARFEPLAAPQELEAPAEFRRMGREHVDSEHRVFVERNYVSPGSFNAGTATGISMVPGYDPLMPTAYRRFFGAREDGVWHGYVRTLEARSDSREPPTVEPALLDRLSVGYYVYARAPFDEVRERPLLAQYWKAVPINDTWPPFYHRRGVPGRARILHRVRLVEDADQALELVRSAQVDPRREVVLWQPPSPQPRIPGVADAGGIPAATPGAPSKVTPGSASIVEDEIHRVVLQARCPSACVLVLADLDYPGWRATVDGRDTPILQADYLLRAVALEAGLHEVVFAYDPASVRVGAAISAAALLLALALACRRD